MKENGILSDLYNKVMSFFISEHDETKGVALNRIKTVLKQDRIGFSERAMQLLREDMTKNIQKYMEMDDELFELKLESVDETTVLNISIPITRIKSDEEIDKAFEEHAQKTQTKAVEIVQELEEIIQERAIEIADEIVEEEIKDEIIEVKKPRKSRKKGSKKAENEARAKEKAIDEAVQTASDAQAQSNEAQV